VRRIALLAAVAALLAGCSTPPAGTDGDLTNGWAAQPSPSERVPAVGSCLTTGGIVAYTDKADPLTSPADCTGKHYAMVSTKQLVHASLKGIGGGRLPA
jgi:hypothetical protein